MEETIELLETCTKDRKLITFYINPLITGFIDRGTKGQ
jgi:hypothetical protein